MAAAEIDLRETLPALRVCPNDSDFYRVQVAANTRLVVDVAYAHAAGRDLDLRVFAQGVATAQPCPAGQCNGTDGTEHFEQTPTAATTYFVEVFGFSGGENQYSLTVSN